LVEATGYGTGPGLGGWNCRHSMLPYYEGMSRVYTDKELEELKPNKENGIILTDKEQSALNSYISSDSYKINDKLRNGFELNKTENELINNLDKALEKCNKYNGNIIRVLEIKDLNKLNDFIQLNKIDSTITFKEYLSFSNKKGYNKNANVIIYVDSKNGKDITKYNPLESEILYPRNSKFVVENVQEYNNKVYIMWREINE